MLLLTHSKFYPFKVKTFQTQRHFLTKSWLFIFRTYMRLQKNLFLSKDKKGKLSYRYILILDNLYKNPFDHWNKNKWMFVLVFALNFAEENLTCLTLAHCHHDLALVSNFLHPWQDTGVFTSSKSSGSKIPWRRKAVPFEILEKYISPTVKLALLFFKSIIKRLKKCII